MDGTHQEATQEPKEEVKDLFRTPKGLASSAEAKEDTRDGTRQEVNKETKEEVKASFRTASATALSAAAGGALPLTAQEALTR